MNQVSFKNTALNTTGLSTKMNETTNTNNKSLKQSKSNSEIKVPFYPASTHLSNMSLKKSIAENNAVSIDEKASLFSTWTPLSDEKSNQKVTEILLKIDLFKKIFTEY